MVYHEARKVNGKILNYIVYNMRKGKRWVKKSRYIGWGKMSAEETESEKSKFETELKAEKALFLDKEKILEIDNLSQIYREKLNKLSREEFENFEKSFFTELTYNSNAIEGNTLSLQETSLIINENIAPKGKSMREIYEAKNHKEAIEFLKGYSGDIDELLILKLHSIILKDISENFAGRYRENPVRVAGSDFKFPAPEKVPQMIKNLIYWHGENKRKMHAFELAVVFSAKLVSIHPFVDGNGRISRLLMNFILKKNGYPWINVYNKQREEYLKSVRKANDENYIPILEFMAETLRENMKDFEFV